MFERIKKRLRDLFRRHRRYVAWSLGIALAMWGLGFGLLHSLITQSSLGPIVSNLTLVIPMGLLGFYLNRRLAFGDRQTRVRKSLSRWTVSRVFSTGTSQTSFALMVGVFGLQYYEARLGITAVLGPISYVINNGWVFKGPNKIDKA